jgi:tetratricopeptide (TPR) repeat protein
VDYVEKYILPFSATGYISPALLERLFEAGEFNWLYIDWVSRALERKHLTLDTLYEFPQGLGGACHHEFSRRFPDISLYRRTHRPFLAVLAAACEPMGTAEYARILGCPEADIHDIIRDLGALLSSYENRVRPFHHILIEWLMDEKKSGQHSICLADGHRQIAADAWLQFERDPAAMSDYAKAHLPKHLLVSGDMEKLERCVTDARFVGFALAADTLYELARYWKSIPRQRLRSLCASSSSALLRRKEDAAVGHAAVLGMGQLFQQIGMYADAVVYFGKALFLARRWKDAYAIGQSELNTGWCLRHVDRFDQAIRHASMAMKCFREAGSCEGLARALSVRGICRWHLREDLAALGDLKEAASLYEGCGDSRGRAEALNHLGIVHRSLGMYKEALQCLRDSEALSTRYKDAKSLGKCLNSLGTAYWWMGDREEAIEFYAQANRINEEVNQPYVLGLTANNLGYVLLEKRRYQAAYESFKHARDIRQNLDISSYEMMDVSGLALASHYLQRPDEAKMLTKLAIKKLGHAIAVEDIERLYYNHYLIMKDGNRQEEIESARALRNALNLVKARMRKLADKKVLSRFRDSVPLVRAILKAADET